MKATINSQLNLCLERVTNNSEDEIPSTVHLLQQIEEEMKGKSMCRSDVGSLHEDSKLERI